MAETSTNLKGLPRPWGDYELLAKVAEGGMGIVYKARSSRTGLVVAIKVMREKSRMNPVMLKRFEQEFRTASSVEHPNLVRALDFGDDQGVPYLVMEFVEGATLSSMVDRDGPILEAEAVRLIALVAQGLHRAHKKGIVHRDVKPDNIMVTPEGQAKLTDMGLVKDLGADLNLTRTGSGLGTTHYMAPEQFRNARLADARSDIYGLAATLYAILLGEPPFHGLGPLDAWMKKVHDEFPSPRERNPAISERVDWAIRRAMKGDPAARPATCREFVEDLLGRSTRTSDRVASAPGEPEIWYLRYTDDNGKACLVKGTRGAVRRSLKEGLLGDARHVSGSRAKAGTFKALAQLPEFRDLCLGRQAEPGETPEVGTGSQPTNHYRNIFNGVGAMAVVAAVAVILTLIALALALARRN